MRAVVRRALARSGGEITAGRLRLDQAERRFYVSDQAIELSPREYGILELLLLRRDHVLSKAQIQNHLCEWDEELAETAIELYIHRIRKKLTDSDIEIRTVRGFGYLLRTHSDGGQP
jgi:two-component system, OmpR family, response regulator